MVTRERMREQYTGAEYLLSKVLAEFPLDAAFSAAFAAMLKWMTGLRCSMAVLCGTYSLMTVAGASLGFAIGSLTSSSDSAMTAGMPVMVILMIVGIINPSGAKNVKSQPFYLQWLKLASPIKWAIEALCVAEYRGMRFETRKGFFRRLLDTPRMGAYALVQNGDQVLDALALSYVSYEDTMKGLATVVGANLFVSLIGLTFLGPSYVQATGAQREEPISENGDRIPSEKFRSEVERPRSSTSAKNKHNRLLNAPTTRGI